MRRQFLDGNLFVVEASHEEMLAGFRLEWNESLLRRRQITINDAGARNAVVSE